MNEDEPADAPPRIVAIYARTSMPKQKTVPAQIDLCRAECKRRGVTARYILKDKGISATTEDRSGYQRLLDLIAYRKIDAVVVWKLDRVVRSIRHFVDFTGLLNESKVDLVSLTEQIDTSSAFGRFNLRNIASVGELEREIIGERSRLGRYRMAEQGRWTTNVPPFGYELGLDRRLVKDSHQARIVQRIFSMYNQKLPLTEISRRLGVAGVTGTMGKKMEPSSIKAIVTNPIYIGRWSHMNVTQVRPDLRIIHDKTWQKAQSRIGTRCTAPGNQKRRATAMESVFSDYLAYLDAQETIESF